MSNEANLLQRRRLVTWLFNPFYYVAGGAALAWGVVMLITTGLVGALSNSHFDGVLDFHTGASASWWAFPTEVLIDWLALSAVLFIIGKIISTSNVRMVDVFGTQAIARTPSLFSVLFALLPGYGRFTEAINKHFMQQIATPAATPMDLLPSGANIVDFAQFLIVICFMIIMLVWMVALMYRAFAVSCNVRGWRSAVGFIVGLLVAEVISKFLIIFVLRHAMG